MLSLTFIRKDERDFCLPLEKETISLFLYLERNLMLLNSQLLEN